MWRRWLSVQRWPVSSTLENYFLQKKKKIFDKKHPLYLTVDLEQHEGLAVYFDFLQVHDELWADTKNQNKKRYVLYESS